MLHILKRLKVVSIAYRSLSNLSRDSNSNFSLGCQTTVEGQVRFFACRVGCAFFFGSITCLEVGRTGTCALVSEMLMYGGMK